MKQLHNVVMLPTNEATLLYSVGKQLSLRKTPIEVIGNDYGNHHLYLTSSEEIKEGDWFLSDDRNHISETPKYRVEQCIAIENGWIYGSIDKMGQGHNPDWSKKIVATTDKSLRLPEIPESFIQAYIKAYNEGKPITEVLVEYEEFFKGAIVEYRGKEYLMEDCNNYSRSYLPIEGNGQRLNSSRNELFIKNPKLKLRSDNTVIISPSKTYTREEVITFAKYAKNYQSPNTVETAFNKWIEQNL